MKEDLNKNVLSIKQLGYEKIYEALNFLYQFEDSSQFLIENLRCHGTCLTKHPNSGNFKIILNKQNEIEGLFVLTRRGNLLAQVKKDFFTDLHYALFILEEIEKDRAHSQIDLKGFLGDYDSIHPLFQVYKKENPSFSPLIYSKEILYKLDLKSPKAPLEIHESNMVRHLEREDYSEWIKLYRLYCEEIKVPFNDLTDEERKDNFLAQASLKKIYGLFLSTNRKMVSIASLTSSSDEVGQIGSVFTLKEFRRQGYAKVTMLHLLKYCQEELAHKKNILFTGEQDLPAQKLYEKMGYEPIGYFLIAI